MLRVRDERGAVSVVVALLMVVLLGFAAIAVDGSNIYAKRQRLQNGADAAALAIAQTCATGSCGSTLPTAQSMIAANLPGDTATVTQPTINSNSVTVTASTKNDNFFAPILGISQSTLYAQASASWGQPVGGPTALPLAFSYCEWKAQTGGGVPSSTTPVTIYFPKTSATSCTGPSGNALPGGFGWLDANAGNCKANYGVGTQAPSDPGNSLSSSCATSDFVAQQNKTVLLALYDAVGMTGNNGWYRIYGYVAFQLTGYSLGGQYSWNSPCSGNDRCIRGYFTSYVDLSTTFTYGTGNGNLGLSIIKLTR